LTSSILYSYIRSSIPTPGAFTPLYVPVTNIPRADIQLRPEFLALLRHANLEPQHLITLTELPTLSEISAKLPAENTKWILVDHNALQGELGKIYSGRVAGAIDHHDEEGVVPKETGLEPRVITKTGSCTSLVTEYCRDAWDQLSAAALSSGAANAQGDEAVDDGAMARLWDAQVAKFALASILIDTSNLKSEDKVTEHDKAAVEYLDAKIIANGWDAVDWDRSSFFEEISKAKRNINDLRLHDILRKDYKQWDASLGKLGISSVVKPIHFLARKAEDESKTGGDAFLTSLKGFASDRALAVYVLMTTATSGEGHFQRELLVWALSDKAAAAAKQFAQSAQQELGLDESHDFQEKVIDTRGDWCKVWYQREVKHSRKRVAPLLREAMG